MIGSMIRTHRCLTYILAQSNMYQLSDASWSFIMDSSNVRALMQLLHTTISTIVLCAVKLLLGWANCKIIFKMYFIILQMVTDTKFAHILQHLPTEVPLKCNMPHKNSLNFIYYLCTHENGRKLLLFFARNNCSESSPFRDSRHIHPWCGWCNFSKLKLSPRFSNNNRKCSLVIVITFIHMDNFTLKWKYITFCTSTMFC